MTKEPTPILTKSELKDLAYLCDRLSDAEANCERISFGAVPVWSDGIQVGVLQEDGENGWVYYGDRTA